MKICPDCGERATDDAAFCAADGAELEVSDSATTERPPGRVDARETPRVPFPGEPGSKIDEFTVVRSHAEGDLRVTDADGRAGLLVFGPLLDVTHEAAALLPGGPSFPALIRQGHADAIGHFVVVSADRAGAIPLVDTRFSFAGGVACLRSLLEVAAEIEARGFAWEPAASDLYVGADGGLVVARARGARPLREGERLNAKRVLEALADVLLPDPLGRGTPELVRLVLPRWNFTTVSHRTITATRELIIEAEAAAAAKNASVVGQLCDAGLRRNHNEDAIAVAEGNVRGEPYVVLVVCDGVSSSTHAERASTIASQVARDALVRFAVSGQALEAASATAMAKAIQEAHAGICTAEIDYGDGAPPGTTIVAAFVFRKTLTVGWVGDSRAYWVSDRETELCTTDHSWVNEAVARGDVTPAEARTSPLAHALTRCLGPLETRTGVVQDVLPEVRVRTLTGRGHLILCSDGLWNYFPGAEVIADLVERAGPGADASAIARFLVCQALAEGGGDNVSVAVHALG